MDQNTEKSQGDIYNYNIHIEGTIAPNMQVSGPVAMGRDHTTVSTSGAGSMGGDHPTASSSGSASQLPGSAPNPVNTAKETISSEVLRILSDLKIKYERNLSQVTPFPWMGKRSLCDLKKHFHTLHLVTQDIKEKLRRQFKKNTSLPEISESLRERDPIKMCDIFNPHGGRLPRRILIEGEPGIGKTSLCVKLAADWSQGEEYIKDKFIGTFFIRARNIMDDNLEMHFSKHLPKPNNAKELLKYIGKNQDNFLFIIDGLDEVINTLPDDWIDLIKSGFFISSCVLVTSRTNQWQSKLTNTGESQESLLQIFDTEIVNIGFTQETALQFIESQSQSKMAVEEKKSLQLSMLPDLVHSPLFCMFLCFMWKEGYFLSINDEGDYKFRRTGLYVDMIKCLIKRFQERLNLPSSRLKQRFW